MKLRPYQEKALDEIINCWREFITRQLVVLPTGTGKTIVFSSLINNLKNKSLVIAHSEELINQAVEKIKLVCPEADIGIVKAERNELNHRIVVASIQTIRQDQRLQELKKQGFSVLIIDEAHHATADTYVKVITELGFMEDDPSKLLVGFTATPNRADGTGLDNVFQKITYKSTILKMIKAGYLSDIKCIKVQTNIDISGVSSSMGDFISSQLANVINTEERNNLIIKSYMELTPDTKAIAFTPNVQHAIDLSKAFNKSGIKTEAIYSEMKADDRQKIIESFKNGTINVLTNCMVLVEGFDVADVETLLMARPTRSQSLFTQMVGRGTRIYPGKKYCTVLDFADTSKHKICDITSLAGKQISMKQGESLLEAVERTESQQDKKIHSKGNIIAKEVSLIDESRVNWITTSIGNFRAGLGSNKYIQLVKAGDKYIIELKENGVLKLLSDKPLPLEYAQGTAEDYIREHGTPLADKEASWRAEKPSTKQIEILKGKGKYKEGMTKGEASDLMSQLFIEQEERKSKPASEKQIRLLTNKGYKIPATLTAGEAGSLIGQLKRAVKA